MGNNCKKCSSEDFADEPLIRAIRKNSVNGVRKCLRSKNRGSATSALVEASINANEGILNLLATVEDVNVRNSVGQTALLEVMASNRRSSVEALLKIGADPNLRHDRTGDTPLIFATRNGFADIVGVLLKFSADVNCLNNEMSALMVACQLGLESIVRLLIGSEKCDMELTNAQNENGLMFACASGKLGTALYLISSGCNVNRVDTNGMNALMKAASGGHCEIVKLLVKNGAHVSAEDGSGRTAETHASMKGHSAIELYLAEVLARFHQNDITENGGAVNPYTKVESCGIEHVIGSDTTARNVETDGASCTKESTPIGVLAVSLCNTHGVLPPVEASDIIVSTIGTTNNVNTVETQRELKQIVKNIAERGANGDLCGTTHESDNSTGCDVPSAMSTLTSTGCKCDMPSSGICDMPTRYETPTDGTCDTLTRYKTPANGIRDTPISYDTPTSGICDTPTECDTPSRYDTLTNGHKSDISNSCIFDTPTSRLGNPTDSGIFEIATSRVSNATDSGIFDTPTSRLSNATDSGIFDTPTSRLSNASDSGIFDTPTSRLSNPTDTPSIKLSNISTSVRTVDDLDVIAGNNSPLDGAQDCEDKVELLTPVHAPHLETKVTKIQQQQAKKIVAPMSKTFPRRKIPEWVKDEKPGNVPTHVDDREVILNTPDDAQKTQSDSAIHIVDNTPSQGKCHCKKGKENKKDKCCKTIIYAKVANIQEAKNILINVNDPECCHNKASTESDQPSDENS